MVDSILQIIASLVGVAAAAGVDAILAKWVAVFTVMIETKASDDAKRAFSETLNSVREKMKGKGATWQDWRDNAQKPPIDPPPSTDIKP